MRKTGVAAAACSALEEQATAPSLRKLTVTVTIEAQTTDDGNLAPLVDEALREFLDNPEYQDGGNRGSMQGKFESKAGLDVSWRAMNAYYEHGNPIGVYGVDSSGREIDTMQGGV